MIKQINNTSVSWLGFLISRQTAQTLCSGMKVKWSSFNNYNSKKICVHIRKGIGSTRRAMKTEALAVYRCLWLRNLSIPPLFYLCNKPCCLWMPWALWLLGVMSSTVDALQDSPYRAIMSTPVYQFMLPTKGPPKPAFAKTWVGTACSPNLPKPPSTSTPFLR